jgi:acylphosphatase
MSEPLAVRVRVHGLVQGVGYRESLREVVEARGVVGWVRNRRDGTVEALLQGESAAVREVVAWCRHGPRSARVDKVDVSVEPPSALQGFERLPSD